MVIFADEVESKALHDPFSNQMPISQYLNYIDWYPLLQYLEEKCYRRGGNHFRYDPLIMLKLVVVKCFRRLSTEGEALVLHSDLDQRGFFIPLDGVAEVLGGGTAAGMLLPAGETIGDARLSASGKAVDFRVDPFLYNSPVERVTDVLDGKTRKAAVFMGREAVK